MSGAVWGATAQAASELFGTYLDYEANRQSISAQYDIAAQNRAYEKDFATNSIQWKVADAKKAGIHPLAALGASTFQPNAQRIFTNPTDYSGSMSRMGQNINRAITAGMTQHQKDMMRLQRERASLENKNLMLKNQQLNKEITEVKQTTMPGPGVDRNGVVMTYDPNSPEQVMDRSGTTYTMPGVQWKDVPVFKGQEKGIQAGMHHMFRFVREPEGWLNMIPDSNLVEGMSDLMVEDWRYTAKDVRRLLRGMFNTSGHKEFLKVMKPMLDKVPIRKNEKIIWDRWFGQFRIVPKGRR